MAKPYCDNSPFMNEFLAEMTALEEGKEIMTVNGSPMGRAIWNLIISKRDLNMYCTGSRPIKPHRFWKVTDVKRYFGIKGRGQKLYDNFMALYVDVMGEDK